MQEYSTYQGDFYKDLAVWVQSHVAYSKHIYNLENDIRRLEGEISWMENFIKSLAPKLARRPSTIKEINTWKHNLRRS